MFFVDLIDLFESEKEENEAEEDGQFVPEYLYLENILPSDVPHKDRSLPKTLPNKRMIIIDI
jgi:hypothetical protein